MRDKYLNIGLVLFVVASFFVTLNKFDWSDWKLLGSGWLFDLAVHFTPHLAVFGLGLGVCCYIAKRYLVLCGLLIISVFHLSTVIGFNDFRPVERSEAPGLKIVSVNIMKSSDALRRVMTFARAREADIVFISEMADTTCKALQDDAPEFTYCQLEFENYNGAPLSRAMAILAKKAPSNFSVLYNDEFYGRAILSADFEVAGEKSKFVFVHPIAPGFPAAMRARDATLQAATELAKNSPSFVIMGDLNTTPWARVYRNLAGHRAGDPRFVSTWMTRMPLIGLPIDHVLISDQMRVNTVEVGGYIGSDHRPVFVELSRR